MARSQPIYRHPHDPLRYPPHHLPPPPPPPTAPPPRHEMANLSRSYAHNPSLLASPLHDGSQGSKGMEKDVNLKGQRFMIRFGNTKIYSNDVVDIARLARELGLSKPRAQNAENGGSTSALDSYVDHTVAGNVNSQVLHDGKHEVNTADTDSERIIFMAEKLRASIANFLQVDCRTMHEAVRAFRDATGNNKLTQKLHRLNKAASYLRHGNHAQLDTLLLDTMAVLQSTSIGVCDTAVDDTRNISADKADTIEAQYEALHFSIWSDGSKSDCGDICSNDGECDIDPVVAVNTSNSAQDPESPVDGNRVLDDLSSDGVGTFGTPTELPTSMQVGTTIELPQDDQDSNYNDLHGDTFLEMKLAKTFHNRLRCKSADGRIESKIDSPRDLELVNADTNENILLASGPSATAGLSDLLCLPRDSELTVFSERLGNATVDDLVFLATCFQGGDCCWHSFVAQFAPEKATTYDPARHSRMILEGWLRANFQECTLPQSRKHRCIFCFPSMRSPALNARIQRSN